MKLEIEQYSKIPDEERLIVMQKSEPDFYPFTAGHVPETVREACSRRMAEVMGNLGREEMKQGPYSVVDKTQPAPSGDPHDYVSYMSYWWPVRNKDGSISIDARDGRRWPGSATPEKTSLKRLSTASLNLALAHIVTGEKAFANYAVRLLRVWFFDNETRMNPHFEFSQIVPGKNQGSGSGVIDGIVLMRVIECAELLEKTGCLSVSDSDMLKKWFKAYLNWLNTNELSVSESRSTGNHGSWNDTQRARIALYLGMEREAKTILDNAAEHRVACQIDSEGVQPREIKRTQSLHYSMFNLYALLYMGQMSRYLGGGLLEYSAAHGGSIQKAVDYLAAHLPPERNWPFQEISGETGWTSVRTRLGILLQIAAFVYAEKRYNRLVKKHLPEITGSHPVECVYSAKLLSMSDNP